MLIFRRAEESYLKDLDVFKSFYAVIFMFFHCPEILVLHPS